MCNLLDWAIFKGKNNSCFNLFFLRAATLPIWELRFVSLALRLKNMCKGENPASDSVDADPVT